MEGENQLNSPYGASHPDQEAGLPDLTLKGFEESLSRPALVTIVGKNTCGFFRRACDILAGTGVKVDTFDISQLEEGSRIHKEAEAKTGHKTTPIIFIKGEYIGGCDSLVQLEKSGELYLKIGAAAPQSNGAAWVSGTEKRDSPLASGFFYFPHTVNSYVVRMIALQMVIVSVVAIVFREHTWAAWMTLGMAFDFLIRLVGGGGFSPAGAFAMLVTSPLQEKLCAGPQKQFATFVGLCFSATAGFCMINGHEIVAAVILGGLAGAAALEAFFDVCLGCYFFGFMIKLGLVDSRVNDVHIDNLDVVKNTLAIVDDFSVSLNKIEEHLYTEPGQPTTAADILIKRFKSDDHVRTNFNPIKYVMISDTMMPLGIAGLALAWRKTACIGCTLTGDESYFGPSDVWQVIAYIALSLFTLITILILVKCVVHPRKVLSEMKHPVKSNFIAALPMCICLFSILLVPDSKHMRNFQKALFWMGAAPLKVLLVWKAAHLVGNRGDAELLTPAILLPIGGCLVASMNAMIFSGYQEIAWFLFSLPALLSILLFGTTFTHSIGYHWSDERVRASVGMWSTVLHLIMLAFESLNGNAPFSSGPVPTANVSQLHPFSKMLFWSGTTLALVMMWLAVPMGFVFRMKFDFSFWSVAFTADILAAACNLFTGRILPDDDVSYLGEYLTAGTLFLACWANATLLLQTMFWLTKRRWLRPQYKFGPLSFNKLSHEALRASGDHLLQSARRTAQSVAEGAAPEAVHGEAQRIAQHLKLHLMVLDWHSHMEDTVMFRVVDSFHPMVTKDAYIQHQHLHRMEAQAKELCKELLAAEGDNAAKLVVSLKDLLEEAVPFADKHMDWEEDNLNGLLRKRLNLALQKKMLSSVWDAYNSKSMEEVRCRVAADPVGDWAAYDFTKNTTLNPCAYEHDVPRSEIMSFPPKFPHADMPIEKQHVLRVCLPFIVRWLPMQPQKARFLKSLAWAIPEQAQLIGDMVYRGVPDSLWAMIALDVPEVIPRGLPGWVRRV